MSAQTMVAPATHTKTTHQPKVPTREQVIQAIIHDARLQGLTVGTRDAGYIDDMFAQAAVEIRVQQDDSWRSRLYYLSSVDLQRIHKTGLLDVVVPDERVAPIADSAHELLGLRHLQGSELSFVHTFGELRGGRYCAVAIAVDTTSAA